MRRLAMFLILLGSLVSLPAHAGRVVDVRVGAHAEKTRIVIELDQPSGYRIGQQEIPTAAGTVTELVVDNSDLMGNARDGAVKPSHFERLMQVLYVPNVMKAGLDAYYVRGDARTSSPEGVTVVLTNPPMGRRLIRDGTLGPLLDAFLSNAGRVLPRSGRMVWLSPAAQRTARVALAAGFHVTSGPEVDMGGFPARVQTLTRL